MKARYLLFLLIFAQLCTAETVKLSQSASAYDPVVPSKKLGVFDAGSELEVDPTARPDGMVAVKFKQPDGTAIEALCNRVDIFPNEQAKVEDKKAEEPAKDESAFGKSSLYSKISTTLVDASMNGVSKDRLAKLQKSKYVLVYFSAHWCGPCREFTPKLVDFYNQNAEKHPMEVIFMSSDRDQDSMKGYMSGDKMPWLAVRYANIKASPLKQFGGKGIPRLVLLDEKGELLKDSYEGENYIGPTAVMNALKKKLK